MSVCHSLSVACSDLSGVKDLQLVILNTFSSQSEEVRSAASYALGNEAVVNESPMRELLYMCSHILYTHTHTQVV